MWKFTLLTLVALLATTYGGDYFNKVSSSMNEAVNNRYSCSDIVIDDYSDECSVLESADDSDIINQAYGEALSVLSGICIYELTRTNANCPQLTSVKALTVVLGQIGLKSTGTTREHIFNLMNVNASNQLRYLLPSITTEEVDDTGYYSSSIYTTIFTVSDVADQFKSCFEGMVQGSTQVVDFSDPTSAAATINAWFSDKTSNDEIHVYADEINNNTGLIFGTFHKAEIWFDQFAFTEQVVLDFNLGAETIAHEMWVGKGVGKVTYNEKLRATIVEIGLKGGNTAVIIKSEIAHNAMEKLLFNLRDSSLVSELCAETEQQNIKVTMPIFENNYGKEDYVRGLQLANQLTEIYDSEFEDFSGIFDGQSGYISHMFHSMHLKVNGLGTTDEVTSDSEITTEVVIDGPFVYYVLSSGVASFIGTYYGTQC